jgi:hypothetical protein
MNKKRACNLNWLEERACYLRLLEALLKDLFEWLLEALLGALLSL